MELASPASVDDVRKRIKAGLTSSFRAAYSNRGGQHVIGRVGRRRLSLTAITAGVRNSWCPSVRGRLEPTATGSRFVGRLGWSIFTLVFSATWLGLAFCLFLALLGHAIVLASNGDAGAPVFLVCLAPLGGMVLFFGLSSWGIHVARKDEVYLRSWLEERLRTAGSGIRGYQPWQDRAM